MYLFQGVQRVIEDRIEREEPLSKGSVRGVISTMMRTVFPAMILSSFCQMVGFCTHSTSFRELGIHSYIANFPIGYLNQTSDGCWINLQIKLFTVYFHCTS